MKKQKIYIAVIGILVIIVAFLAFRNCSRAGGGSAEVKVVDIIRLFNQYQLKIDMEQADSILLGKKIKEIDSVRAILELQKEQLSEAAYHQQLYRLDVSFEEAHAASNDRINEAVWKKLNVIIKEYGKKQGIKVLVGANGMGNVMYFDDSYDITDDLLNYINAEYAKK